MHVHGTGGAVRRDPVHLLHRPRVVLTESTRVMWCRETRCGSSPPSAPVPRASLPPWRNRTMWIPNLSISSRSIVTPPIRHDPVILTITIRDLPDLSFCSNSHYISLISPPALSLQTKLITPCRHAATLNGPLLGSTEHGNIYIYIYYFFSAYTLLSSVPSLCNR